MVKSVKKDFVLLKYAKNRKIHMKPYPKFKGDWQLKIHLKSLEDTFVRATCIFQDFGKCSSKIFILPKMRGCGMADLMCSD